MATVILVRHGRSTANADGILAGRLAGVHLDDVGREQARATGERLAAVPLAAVVSSPLERCLETARHIAESQPGTVSPRTDERLVECGYGSWQGRALKELSEEELWRTVQHQPSAARFPGGESLREMADRSVAAIREHDAAVEAEHGPTAVWAAVSHGDVIKSVLSDAAGAHLDHFQRIVVDPASVSIVRLTSARPFVLQVNSHGGDLGWLVAPPAAEEPGSGDAVVGGGAGPAPTGPRL